jgi:hypothetical protein
VAKLPRLREAGALAAVLLVGCGAEPIRPRPVARIESCHYDVRIASEHVVEVDARCKGEGLVGFRGTEKMLPFIANAKSGGRAVTQSEGLFRTARLALSYRIDLGRAGEAIGDYDLADRIGDSVIAPASSFLLAPEPLTDAPVTVSVHKDAGTDFVTGLKQDGDLYSIEAHEIPLATYSYFGHFARDTVELPDARIEIITLDRQLAVQAVVRTRWIEASARAVAQFYGRFPVPRTVLGVLPVLDRDDVVFGKVLPESSPGIVLLVGERASKRALYDEWMLVHELFHLGFPSFDKEGKWLDEGLATYFEPIIRARAGFISERQVWREFFQEMPYGLSSVRAGLEKSKDFRGMYWGGAIVCLLADIEARRASLSKLGLEAGLHRVLEAGGDASRVWELSETVRLIDSAFSKPILADLSRAYGKLGASVDLPALFGKLGVRSAGNSVEFDDKAPLAAVRRAIVRAPR